MAQVVALAGRVQAHAGGEDDGLTVVRLRGHLHLARVAVLEALDRELLPPGETEALGALAVGVLERDDAHPDQVRAVDALVRLGDHGAHAEEVRALGRPVARRARAVLLAREDDQRHAFLVVALGGVEDRHLLAVREVRRPRSLAALHEQVAKAHVGEGTAQHHLVVPAPRAVRVEVLRARRRARSGTCRPGCRGGSRRPGRCGRW